MNKSKSVNKIILILLLTAMFFGITFNVFSNHKSPLDKTGAYLTSQGGLTGIIQLGGEKLSVTQNGVGTNIIYFNEDYFVTDKKYEYNIGIKNTEKAGGSDSKYLRWKWTAVIDGVEENINKYVTPVKNENKQAYIMENWFYLVDNDYVAAKLEPQEELNILTELRFNGEYDIETEKYGSLLDKYYSGSNIQIYLTVQGSTDDGNEEDKWAIETPQAIIYDHKGGEIVRTDEFGEYTIPADIVSEEETEGKILKEITVNGSTAYFQGYNFTDLETGESIGSIFYPGDTVALNKFDRLKPVYSQDLNYDNKLVFSMDNSVGTWTVRGINGGGDGYYNTPLGNSSVTEIEIPTLKAGDVVAVIEDYGFYSYTALETVSLGQQVTAINAKAFQNCTNLKTINIPETVTSIGQDAFYHCRSLQSITLPSNLSYLGPRAFGDCNINVTIPEDSKLEVIPYSLFEDGGGTINIPPSVKTIELEAFYNAAVTVTLSENSQLEVIGDKAFQHFGVVDAGWPKINYFPSTLKTIGAYAFAGNDMLQGNLLLPAGLTNLGEHAFAETGITSFGFEEGATITEIPNAVCYFCKSLKSVSIPESVTSLGLSAFYGPIEEIYYNAVSVESAGKYMKDSDDNDRSEFTFSSSVPVSVVIGNKVERIPTHCFVKVNIKDFTFEENSVCNTIGMYAFRGNKTMQTFTMPASMRTIGEESFYQSTLEVVNFNEGIETIESSAFWGTNLVNLVLPNSVTYLGSGAFALCESLKTVKLSENITFLGSSCFLRCYYVESLYYNITSVSNTITSDPAYWKPFGYLGFNTNLLTITVANNVLKIPKYAFYMYYSDGDNYINYNVALNFEANSKLKTIESYAFWMTFSHLSLPASLEFIGSGAFYECRLSTVEFAETSGWVARKSGLSDVALSETDLSNSATIVTYLKNTYRIYDWVRIS